MGDRYDPQCHRHHQITFPEHIGIVPLLWALSASILVGISCFCIGLTSHYDNLHSVISYSNVPQVLQNISRHTPSGFIQVSSYEGNNNRRVRLEKGDLNPCKEQISSTIRNLENHGVTRHKIKTDAVIAYNSTVTTTINHELRSTTFWWWRVVFDLSVLWLTNGLTGIMVGLYLLGNFGGLLLSSASMDVVFPPEVAMTSHLNPNVKYEGGEEGSPSAMMSKRDERLLYPNLLCEVQTLGDEMMDKIVSSMEAARTCHQETLELEGDEHICTPSVEESLKRDYDTPGPDSDWLDIPGNERNKSSNGSLEFHTTVSELVEDGNSRLESTIQDQKTCHHATANDDQWMKVFEKKTTGSWLRFKFYRLFASSTPMIGGLAIASSQAALKVGFWSTADVWGPICAISGSDVAIVLLIFEYFFNTPVMKFEKFAAYGILIGACLMPLWDFNKNIALGGFICGAVSAFAMGVSVIATRIAALVGVSSFTGFFVRSMSQGCLGLIGLLLMGSLESGRKYLSTNIFHPLDRLDSLRLIGIPIFAGIFQALGMGALNFALTYPLSGSAASLLPLHSLTVMGMVRIVFGVSPNWGLTLGVILICCGCLLLPAATSIDRWSHSVSWFSKFFEFLRTPEVSRGGAMPHPVVTLPAPFEADDRSSPLLSRQEVPEMSAPFFHPSRSSRQMVANGHGVKVDGSLYVPLTPKYCY